LHVPKLEKDLGIEIYGSKSLGVGGRIRLFIRDFVVEEVLTNGSKAGVTPIDVEKELPPEKDQYLLCILVKRNWDTFLAVKEIGRRLGISYKRIRIGGIKDARAITAQHISLRNVTAERIKRVRIKDMTLRVLSYSGKPISSKLLYGNEFKIAIREIQHPKSTVEKRVEATKNELFQLGGVPNFFGHQRFGTIRPITHLVGKALAKNQFERAMMLFLAEPSENENPASREVRQKLLDTQNFREASKSFPYYLKHERLMLNHLSKHPNDFVGAFRRLHKNLCRLFLQAYQSHLFNRFLSQRMLHGLPLNEPQVGDYVVYLNEYGLPTSAPSLVTKPSLNTLRREMERGRIRIALPIIGFDQPTSSGRQGAIEVVILESEKVSPSNFYVPSMPEISCAGKVRAALMPLLKFKALDVGENPAESFKHSITFNFILERGSYATILLRELMKPTNLIGAGF